MKKITALLLAVLMLLSMAACSSKSAETTPTPAAETTTETKAEETASTETAAEPASELRKVKFCLTRTAEVLEDTPFWVAHILLFG